MNSLFKATLLCFMVICLTQSKLIHQQLTNSQFACCPATYIFDVTTLECKCPPATPYVQNGKCIACSSPSIWIADSQTCITCSNGQVYNATTKQCGCPQNTPYLDSNNKCVACAAPGVWNAIDKKCIVC
jgi:hypothetical protein